MIAAVGLFVAFATQLVFASASVCTLDSPQVSGREVVLFDYSSFDDSVDIIRTWTYIVDEKLRLAIEETNGGTVGYAWHNERERIADGFVSTFKFNYSNAASAGDGFTYFIQNSGIVDLNGGTGDKLGSFGIGKSIAVRFDLCVDRPAPCTRQEVGLSLVDADFNELPLSPALTPVNVSSTLTAGTEHTVVIAYEGRAKGSAAALSVSLDGTQLFNRAVGDLTTSLFDDRFAHFGFTASTSWTETSNIDINSWSTVIMPSDTIVLFGTTQLIADTVPRTVDFGTIFEVTVQRQDTCGVNIVVDENLNVSATMTQTAGDDPETLIGNVTNNEDGSYTILFDLPLFYEDSYDLDVLVNQVRPANIPFLAGIVTKEPDPVGSGLPIWALVLLILLILLIILVLSYVVYRLHRYRKKLKENAEFIEAGKKQAELDRLEDGTTYAANPMVGTIDDLKTQLTKNEEELERLRQRGAIGEDQNFTIEQLQKQRDALLEEMNRLKREEQEEELRRKKAGDQVYAGSKAKKEFGREQI